MNKEELFIPFIMMKHPNVIPFVHYILWTREENRDLGTVVVERFYVCSVHEIQKKNTTIKERKPITTI